MPALTPQVSAFLEREGYQLLQTSVQNKNQTRFLYLILAKGHEKYFCKVNKYDDAYDPHLNSSLSKYFAKSPSKIHFVTPTEIFDYQGVLISLYPYIDQAAVSSESEKFNDFNVPPAELDDYLKAVIQAINFVASRKLMTTNDSLLESRFEDEFIKLVGNVRVELPQALESIKYLLREGKLLKQKTLAINDIQPQNMFWKSRGLYLFDTEHLGPNYKYYDYARFSSYLWFLHQKPVYAQRFLELSFNNLTPEEKQERYSYIKFMLIWTLLSDYTNFKSADTRQHIVTMLKWVKKDLLYLVNES